jgi:hypothetical protein
MKASMRRWLILGAATVAVLVAVWWWRLPGREAEAVDLVDEFPVAEKRSIGPIDVMLIVGTHRVRGDAKRGIYMHPTSRLTYRGVRIPEHGQLRSWVALKEEVWDRSTDGVLFRVGVSDGSTYTDLATRHVDPRNNLSDRQWLPLDAELSSYAGRTVDVILNTNASVPGKGNDPTSDFAVWGEPQIVPGSRRATR